MSKGGDKRRGERHKTIILLRPSTFPQPSKVARGQRRGSDRPDNGLFYFGLSERNKIFILLRSLATNKIIGAVANERIRAPRGRPQNSCFVAFGSALYPPLDKILPQAGAFRQAFFRPGRGLRRRFTAESRWSAMA